MTNQCRLNLSENELQKIQECLQEIISLVKNIAEIIKNVISPVFLKRLDSKSFHFAKHNKNKRIRKSTRKNYISSFSLYSDQVSFLFHVRIIGGALHELL